MLVRCRLKQSGGQQCKKSIYTSKLFQEETILKSKSLPFNEREEFMLAEVKIHFKIVIVAYS